MEPAPENVECLRRNFVDEIRTGKMTVLPVGVWNETAELPLNIDAGSSARNSFAGTFGRDAIPAAIASMHLGYRIVCGPCLDLKTAVTPDVLYFIPNSREGAN